MKPFIIGENNPYGGHEEFALYPSPRGCSGWRLCHLVLRMDPDKYVEAFERRNVLAQPKWSAPAARAAAAKLVEEIGEAKVILLGAKVSAAFRLNFEPFTIVRGKVAILPHPSGLARAWGVPGAFDRARETVDQLLAVAASMTTAPTQCPVTYVGRTFPQFHGTRCTMKEHPHPEVRHYARAGGAPLQWWDEDQKKAIHDRRAAARRLRP